MPEIYPEYQGFILWLSEIGCGSVEFVCGDVDRKKPQHQVDLK